MHTPGGTSASCPPEYVTLYLLGAPSMTTAHVFRFAVSPNQSTVSGNASDRLKPDAATFVSASVPFAAAVPP